MTSVQISRFALRALAVAAATVVLGAASRIQAESRADATEARRESGERGTRDRRD